MMRFRRATQLRLKFPPQSTVSAADIVRFRREGKRQIVLDRQPRKFPAGWHRASLGNPNWREEHNQQWSRRRKVLGLPHVVKEVA